MEDKILEILNNIVNDIVEEIIPKNEKEKYDCLTKRRVNHEGCNKWKF